MRALTRFLRFLLRVQGAVLVSGRKIPENDEIELRVRRRKNAKARCPECRRELRGKIVVKPRRWRHLDFAGVRCFLASDVREGRCSLHGRRVESVPWAHPAARHTHDFDRQVASLVQVADKSAASRMFGTTWRTVGRIVARVVDDLLPKDRLGGLRKICIDETSYKRGHRYLTVVTCLKQRRVVWIGKGKSAKSLAHFFEELGPQRTAELEVVAIDMGRAYINSVETHAPRADIVFDRFHVVKLLLEAIDEVRREECRKLKGDDRAALKRTRYSLLRNPAHLNPKDEDAIARVRATNARLTQAYQFRVDIEELWKLNDEAKARMFLDNWTTSVMSSNIKPLEKFARTVRNHLHGILGFFRRDRTTSGLAEGMNNKIKLVIHRAFGFADTKALMAMVYLCCTGLKIPTASGRT